MSRFKRPNKDLNQLENRWQFLYQKEHNPDWNRWNRSQINQLADISHPFSFVKGQKLARSGEVIDWLGILTTGKVSIQAKGSSFSELHAGEILGIFGVLELQGNKLHRFDVEGITQGIINVIPLLDLKNLIKKNSKIALKLYQHLVNKALEILNYQFLYKRLEQPHSITTVETPEDKLYILLNMHPQIRLMLDKLERLEVKMFLQLCKIANFSEDQLLLQSGKPLDACFCVLKGSLYELRPDEAHFINESQIFGMSHFIDPGSIWEYDIRGNKPGYILIILRDSFIDLTQNNPVSANKIYKLIFQLYLQDFTHNKTPNIFLANTSIDSPFIEIDIRKTVQNVQIKRPSQDLSDIQEELFQKQQNEYSDLFLFHNHDEYLQFSTNSPRSPRSPRKTAPKSLFLAEKIKKQKIQGRFKRKKSPRRRSRSPRRRRKKSPINPQQEIDQIAREHKKMQEEHAFIQKKIQAFELQNEKLRGRIRAQELIKENFDLQLKKIDVLKELLAQEVFQKKPHQDTFRTFQHTTKDHISLTKEFYLAYKYAKRWRAFISKTKKIA